MAFRLAKVYGRAANGTTGIAAHVFDTGRLTDKRLSTKEKKFAVELMNQQCWCWGQDVASMDNILLRFGFTRHRPSASYGATRYQITRDGLCVALWGFGMWIKHDDDHADRRQGFFSRYRRGIWLLPRDFDVKWVHNDSQILPHLRRPMPGGDYVVAHRLSSAAARWCERYERWIVTHLGPDYRRSTLTRWEHPIVDAHEMAKAWSKVLLIYQKWYRTEHTYKAIGEALSRLRGSGRIAAKEQ